MVRPKLHKICSPACSSYVFCTLLQLLELNICDTVALQSGHSCGVAIGLESTLLSETQMFNAAWTQQKTKSMKIAVFVANGNHSVCAGESIRRGSNFRQL